MRGPGGWTLAAHAVSLLVLGAAFHRPWADAWRWPTAEVAAVGGPPRVAWSLGVAALALAALGGVAVGLWRGRGRDFKGYRLLPIVTVVALFVDVFAFSADAWPPPAWERGAWALGTVGRKAQALASQRGALPTAEELRPLIAELGPPPYRVRGAPLGAFSLQPRERCDGPALEPAGAQAGTLLYCVAADGRKGWLSLVGLPAEVVHGAPAVVSTQGRPLALEVNPSAPPVPDEGGASP